MKEKAMIGGSDAYAHEQAIEAAVAGHGLVERQHRGGWQWVQLTQAEAERAVAGLEHAWLRVCVVRKAGAA